MVTFKWGVCACAWCGLLGSERVFCGKRTMMFWLSLGSSISHKLCSVVMAR